VAGKASFGRAQEVLLRYDSDRVVTVLIDVLESGESYQRIESAQTLAKLAPTSTEALAALQRAWEKASDRTER
jgi:hypothetical protein